MSRSGFRALAGSHRRFLLPALHGHAARYDRPGQVREPIRVVAAPPDRGYCRDAGRNGGRQSACHNLWENSLCCRRYHLSADHPARIGDVPNDRLI